MNRPRVNQFFYLRSLASGYTIFKFTTPNTFKGMGGNASEKEATKNEISET